MYVLTKTVKFHAAHQVHGHQNKDGSPGVCSRLHGHTYRAIIELKTDTLNDIGLGVDYRDIKEEVERITKLQFDHRFLNDHPAFRNQNPTAENISEFLFKQLKPVYEEMGGILVSVTVYESDTSSCKYVENVPHE